MSTGFAKKSLQKIVGYGEMREMREMREINKTSNS
jgi:hypothetical protein